ncbi:MAG: FecR domain-containing protein [Brachymonas sp.]|nr:FecR domain-containing protein [Brachymonas sp.]
MTPVLAQQQTATSNPPATPTGQAALPSGSRVKGSSVVYTVQPGDTLDKVCRKFSVAAAQCPQLVFYNALENKRLPPAGQVVYVPLTLLPSQARQIRLIQTVGDVTLNGQPVKAGIRFDEGARIAAGADSSAVVELEDGSHVKVLPQSVADIVHSRDYKAPDQTAGGRIINWIGSKLRLLQGAVEATVPHKQDTSHVGKPIEVETTTSVVGVRGTEFRVAAADQYVPYDRAEVLAGNVSNINTWKNSEIHLDKGQGAVVDPNVAEMQAIALLPAPQVPAPGMVLRRPQAFYKFSPVPGAVAYRVIVADDAEFNNIRFSEKSTAPFADLNRLPNGVLHIRARAVDAHGLEGQDAQSTVDLRAPAWLLRNASVQEIQGRPYLLWTAIATEDFAPLPDPTTVKVEIARNRNFTQPVTSLTSTGLRVKLPHLPPGRYYFRIGVDNDSIRNNEQQVFAFDMPSNLAEMPYNVLLQPVN